MKRSSKYKFLGREPHITDFSYLSKDINRIFPKVFQSMEIYTEYIYHHMLQDRGWVLLNPFILLDNPKHQTNNHSNSKTKN